MLMNAEILPTYFAVWDLYLALVQTNPTMHFDDRIVDLFPESHFQPISECFKKDFEGALEL